MKGALAELLGRLGLLWLDKKPFSDEKRARRKARRAARKKARRGEALSDEEKQLIQEGQVMNVPAGTTRGIGIGLIGFAPILAIGLTALGVGECTPEAAEQGCQGAKELAATICAGFGAVIYAVGHIRNNRRKRE